MNITWTDLLPNHLDDLNRIADLVHPNLPERPEVMEEKYHLFPEGCKALMSEGRIVGYAMSHPWTVGHIPPLDSFLVRLPANPTCLHLHDIAILPGFRGRNLSAEFIRISENIARKIPTRHLALVSVYGTHTLWRKTRIRRGPSD